MATAPMSPTKLNALIAALIALANSIIPLLQLTGVIDLTSDAVAALYLVISNVGTVAGLMLALLPITNTPQGAPPMTTTEDPTPAPAEDPTPTDPVNPATPDDVDTDPLPAPTDDDGPGPPNTTELDPTDPSIGTGY